MNCDKAQENIVLAHYGELADEHAHALERHLADCEDCRRDLAELRATLELMAHAPLVEPTPNLLAQSRLRLDEALDHMPSRSWAARLRTNFFGWVGHIQTAPALTTLLLGVGFLAGNFTTRYQVANAPKLPPVVNLSNTTNGTVASVSSVVQTPDPNVVQVKYNRLVPEVAQGSLDDPQIRQLLTMGTTMPATMNDVRDQSVSLLASACKAGAGLRKQQRRRKRPQRPARQPPV